MDLVASLQRLRFLPSEKPKGRYLIISDVRNVIKITTLGFGRKKMAPDPIETKTTVVRSAEPLKIKSSVFAKGFKVEISWNLDPNNPIQLDQILLPLQDSQLKQAVDGFIKFNESLGYTHLQDTKEAIGQS